MHKHTTALSTTSPSHRAAASTHLRAIVAEHHLGARLEVCAKLDLGGLPPLLGFLVSLGLCLSHTLEPQAQPNLQRDSRVSGDPSGRGALLN